MKRNAIARIIIYSILALVLTGILVGAIALNELSFDFGDSNGTVVEQEGNVAAADIRNLEIDWAGGNITIRRGDTDQIVFSETAPENCKHQMVYTVSGNTLKLSYSKGNIGIGFGNWNIPDKDLTIIVPQDWTCEALEIDGAAMSISIENLIVDTLELDGAACELNFIGEVRRVDVDGASADLHIECTNRPEQIDIDGASCEVNLILPKNCGFTMDMEGISYGLNTDLPCTNQNGQKVYGDGYCKINVDGVSCEVTISESVECSHEWDMGYPTIEPGSGEQVTVYTCSLCGQTKSESILHTKHTWNEGTSLGENTIV